MPKEKFLRQISGRAPAQGKAASVPGGFGVEPAGVTGGLFDHSVSGLSSGQPSLSNCRNKTSCILSSPEIRSFIVHTISSDKSIASESEEMTRGQAFCRLVELGLKAKSK
jgi:hypothetical protein